MRELNANPDMPLDEVYRYLDNQSTLVVRQVLEDLQPGPRGRVRAWVGAAVVANRPRLELIASFDHALQNRQDPIGFYLQAGARLSLVEPAARQDMLSYLALLNPSPLATIQRLGGFRALTEAEQRLLVERSQLPDGLYGLNSALTDAVGDGQPGLESPGPFRAFLRDGPAPAVVTPTGGEHESVEYRLEAVPGARRAEPRGGQRPYQARMWRLILPDPVDRAALRAGEPRSAEQVVHVFTPLGRHPVDVSTVARHVAMLPVEARRNLHNVYLSPGRYIGPDPGVTVASDNMSGDMVIYPPAGSESPRQFDVTLLHETGHTISQRHWGIPPAGPGWRRWATAMATEPALSAEGQSQLQDDFAEAFAAYLDTRGRPRHAELRALTPQRFHLIDELLAIDRGTGGVADRRASDHPPEAHPVTAH